MTQDGGRTGKTADERGAADLRKARLAEQLRANLQKRKQQARARRAGEADRRQGIGATDDGDPE